MFRNDEITLDGIAALKPDQLVLSPGPCSPAEAGICVPAIQHFAGKLPILGVCLGHQSIGAALGGQHRARAAADARQDERDQHRRPRRLPRPAAADDGDPLPLAGHRARVAARPSWRSPPPRDDGEIMGVRHRELAIEGVQFHPESILSEHGHAMLKNFLDGVQRSHEPVIDLRSDTVTKPTPAMRAAMAAAEVGDDVYGDDPTVNALQERIAGLLGFEAALFLPSGTHEQPVRADGALPARRRVHRRPDGAHLPLGRRRRRGAGQHPAAAAGAAGRRLDPAGRDRGRDQARRRALRAHAGCWRWRTPGAARCCRWPYIEAATALARRRGLATHLDGARLFNAAVATAQAEGGDARAHARAIAGHFDSVSVCFSKGLGAPVGSALCGSQALIARAHRIRKMAGGGMRQAGVLAAARAARAGPPHRPPGRRPCQRPRAGRGPAGPAGRDGGAAADQYRLRRPGAGTAAGAVERLRAAGVLCSGGDRLRLVTHLDVSAADIQRAITVLRATL